MLKNDGGNNSLERKRQTWYKQAHKKTYNDGSFNEGADRQAGVLSNNKPMPLFKSNRTKGTYAEPLKNYQNVLPNDADTAPGTRPAPYQGLSQWSDELFNLTPKQYRQQRLVERFRGDPQFKNNGLV